MEELKDYLAKIYETLRNQQEIAFQLTTRIQALEMSLNTREGFAVVHQAAMEAAATPERIRQHTALLAGFAFEIAQLRGENTTIADA